MIDFKCAETSLLKKVAQKLSLVVPHTFLQRIFWFLFVDLYMQFIVFGLKDNFFCYILHTFSN